MRKSRFTDQQIAFAMRQAEQRVGTGELARKLGVSAGFTRSRSLVSLNSREPSGQLGPGAFRTR
jgi:hypothetical protein